MAKFSSQGSVLEVGDGLGGFIVIEQVTTFDGFDGEATELDVTCLESTAVENVLGLRDFGNFNFDVIRDDSLPGHARLFALQASGAAENFRLTLPTASTGGDTYAWQGLVKSFGIGGGVNAPQTGSVSTKVTGDVTFTNN